MKRIFLSFCVVSLLTVSQGWADESKKAGELPARPTPAVCSEYRKTAEQEAEALLKADIGAMAAREKDRQNRILSEIAAKGRIHDETGFDYGEAIHRAAVRLEELHEQERAIRRRAAEATPEEYRALDLKYRETIAPEYELIYKSIDLRIKALLGPSAKTYNAEVCPAGATLTPPSEASRCRNPGSGPNESHYVQSEVHRHLWDLSFGKPALTLVDAGYSESLQHAFGRKFQLSAHLRVTSQMRLADGRIDTFDIHGNKSNQPAVFELAFDKCGGRVSFGFGALESAQGRDKFKEYYVKFSLLDLGCQDESSDGDEMASALPVKRVIEDGAAGLAIGGAAGNAALLSGSAQ